MLIFDDFWFVLVVCFVVVVAYLFCAGFVVCWLLVWVLASFVVCRFRCLRVWCWVSGGAVVLWVWLLLWVWFGVCLVLLHLDVLRVLVWLI